MDEGLIALIKTMVDRETNTDSIEIGTPSKGGVLKVYFNANDVEASEQKLKKAYDLLLLARAKHAKEESQ